MFDIFLYKKERIKKIPSKDIRKTIYIFDTTNEWRETINSAFIFSGLEMERRRNVWEPISNEL